MAGQRTAGGGNATYTFTYTGLAARIDEIANGAARAIWMSQNVDADPAIYDALPIQQKINILDVSISRRLTALATNNKRDMDVLAAKLAAEAYADENFGL